MRCGVRGFWLRLRDVRQRFMRFKEADVLKWLERVPVLIVDGGVDMLVGSGGGKGWIMKQLKGS